MYVLYIYIFKYVCIVCIFIFYCTGTGEHGGLLITSFLEAGILNFQEPFHSDNTTTTTTNGLSILCIKQ